MKIAIQTGMAEIEAALTAKGYEVVPFREGGTGIKMTILNDIDEEYEEMDPVTFMIRSFMPTPRPDSDFGRVPSTVEISGEYISPTPA